MEEGREGEVDVQFATTQTNRMFYDESGRGEDAR